MISDSEPDIPPIFLNNPLTSSLLTTTPKYTLHTRTTPTSTKIPNPFFNFTLNSNSHSTTSSSFPSAGAVYTTLFLSRPHPIPEGHLLLHIGPGITGQDGIAHGGFLATVMDEVCGNLIAAEGVDAGLGMFTARLDVRYLRPAFVREDLGTGEGNGVVIVATARVERVEGRKVFVAGEIRDALGEVCTSAEAVFVKKQPQAAL
ncbi:PaaI family thioesterase [Aspergillus undulatus]|uniref:PaaI family thioesterase n=1 Tax=Aspergillus undulatus TaxID=1810928 RepID=UPI003CCE1C6A